MSTLNKRGPLLWLFVITLIIAGWFLIKPFLVKQKLEVLDLELEFPKSWHYSIMTTNDAFEGLITTNTSKVRSLQDAPLPGAKAEVVFTVSPKGNLLEYKDSLISRLSSSSKITFSETKIDNRNGIILYIDGADTNNFYSKQILLLVEVEDGVYTFQSGVLRDTGKIEGLYYFRIVEEIIKSIRFK